MPKLYYGEAIKLMLKTLPSLAVIAGINFLFGLAVVVYWAVLYGMIYLTQNLSFLPGLIFLFGIGGTYYGFQAVKKLVLFAFKAGHIAVMAEILENGELPPGKSQLEFGKDQVKARFVEVGALFALDEIVRKVVASVNGMVDGALSLLKIDAFRQLGKIVGAVMSTAANYVDEAILARIFMSKEKNPFKVAAEGSVLYAMAWKPILTNAAGLALFSWASLPIFVVLFIPVGLLMNLLMPGSMFPAITVLVFAYLAKATLVDTFATATTMIAFQKETATMDVDGAVERKLESFSASFRELKAKAGEKMSTVFKSGSAKQEAAAVSLPPLPMSQNLPPIPVAVSAEVQS